MSFDQQALWGCPFLPFLGEEFSTLSHESSKFEREKISRSPVVSIFSLQLKLDVRIGACVRV